MSNYSSDHRGPRFPMGAFVFALDEAWKNPPRNLEEERDQLKRKLAAVEADMQRLAEKPTANAVITRAHGDQITVRVGSQIINVRAPGGTKFSSGELVEVAIEGGAPIRRCEGMHGTGQVLFVKTVHAERGVYELTGPGPGPGTHIAFSAIDGVEEGDRVLLDDTHATILTNLGKPPSEMAFTQATGVTWDDVGGQAEAKRALREVLEEPIVHAALYKQFGKKPGNGVLLFGPPGNGKTMLGKAAATAVAELHGDSGRRGGFIYVKGPEMLDKFVGESEAGVRRLFEAARAHKKAHGYPAVIFIDEADAIVASRGAKHSVRGMQSTVVPQFLAEMDGLEASGAFVILATNRPGSIDEAVLRDGRCDRRVEVGTPTKADFADIVARTLRGKLVAAQDTPEYLGEIAAEKAFTEQPVFHLKSKTKPPFVVHLGSFASGAMAVGVAERATQHALRRHMASVKLVEDGFDPDGPKGVFSQDVFEAVAEAAAEIGMINPVTTLAPMVQAMGQDFAGLDTPQAS